MCYNKHPIDVYVFVPGLTESVVSAALSRVGQRVLHVDRWGTTCSLLNHQLGPRWDCRCVNPFIHYRRSYYAADWASFTFNGLLTWIQEQKVSSKLLFCDWLLVLFTNKEENPEDYKYLYICTFKYRLNPHASKCDLSYSYKGCLSYSIIGKSKYVLNPFMIQIHCMLLLCACL